MKESGRWLHFWNVRRVRTYGLLSFAVFLALFLFLRWTAVNGLDRLGNPAFPDFTVFQLVGEQVIQGDRSRVYDQAWIAEEVNRRHGEAPDGGGYLFLYPPFVAWWCVAIGWLSLAAAQWLWFGLNLILGFGLGWWWPRTLKPGDAGFAGAAMGVFVGSLPFWRTVTFGQNGLWLLAVLSAAWACWKNKQEVVAGLILSLTLAKPQLFGGLYLGIMLLLSWRVMAGLCFGGMVWLASGFAFRGGEGWMEWIRSIQLIRNGREHVEWQHSLLNLFDLSSPSGWLTAAKITTWGIFCIFWVWGLIILWRRERIAEGLGWALWGGLLLTPRLYQYDLILLFPLMVGWAARAVATSEFWAIAGVNAAIYLNDFFMGTRFPFLSLILLLLFFRFYRKIAFQNPLEQNLHK